MTLERSKKPSQVALETGKPKRVESTQTSGAKTPFAPMSATQLQRARARFDRDTALLQRKAAPVDSTPTSQACDQSATLAIQAKQQAFHSSFVKSPVQRRALEQVKNQSIQASGLREQYQTAILPEMVQRLAGERTTQQSQEARTSQAPNALNARTDWFNSELPALRVKHNNPDKPDTDSASVFSQTDARAQDLGKTYVAQRVASGFTANDAASAIVNIQRSRDRNNALKGVLSAIRPQDSDYSRIQRLVSEKEQNLELQRRANEAAVMPQAMQLAKEEANPSQANSGISEKIKAKIGGGSPLPEHVRSQLEAGLNSDLSKVRVHTDSEADALAKSVNAIAFTTGQDIFFQSGKFEPNTKTGYELLAHEVTHTVQQAGGQVKPGVDSDPGLETAAQDSGAKLAANFDPNSKPQSPKTALASAPTLSASSSEAAVQRLSDTNQLNQPVPAVGGKPEQIPGAKPDQNLKIPEAPIPSEAKVVNEQKPELKPSTPAKPPINAKTPKPDTEPKTPKTARVKLKPNKLPAALVKKPVSPTANKLELQADIKPSKQAAPTALKTNVNAGSIAFAPIPNLEKIDPSEKSKLLKLQADSTKAANSTVQNLRKQAQSLEPHGAKLSAQITQAASAAKNLVSQAGSQQKALVNTQISALIAQAKSKGQASIGKSNSDAKAKTGALAGITNTAKQAITTAHQQKIQALKAKLEAQKPLIAAKYDANRGNYETAGNKAGSEAKTVAAAKAETWRGQKSDEGFLEKAASYADFGAGPHPNDKLDAKADADIQTGDGYASGEGYSKVALEAFKKSKQGIERDFENFKTYFHDPRLQALDNQKNNAITQLQSSETSTKQQIEQTRAQMESAMKAQLDGVLQQLTGQKTSLSATIDAVIKQSTSGIDAQSSAQIKGVQTALKSAATGIQSSISQLESQMSGKNAPKPELLKRMLGEIERSVASTVKQTLAQTSQSASGSGKEFNSLAQTSITGMRSSTQQGIQTAKQSEQQLIQSLAQLVQSATTAYAKFQLTHKTTTTKTQADTITEFTNILMSADPAFQAALEQLATNLENAAKDYGKGLVAHANGPDFSKVMTKAEADAEAKVQPRWKGLLKILLIIVVIVVVALVIGPAVIGAVGAFAATMGAGAAAGAIGAVVGGAIVGALSGAVIQMGNNAIDGKAIMDGVGQAMLVGAISGAVGGGLGYAFSSGANVAATSSKAFLQTIGTKANTFAGKMVLDQLNGVVSGQFSSLLTTGKFQNFKELLQDPSTWIGFATSAATTRGGGPIRVTTDTPNAPRINVDVNAPRVSVDAPRVNADVPNNPRANVEGNAPRVNADAPNAPRVNTDAPNAPRTNVEPTAPRANADVLSPRADADAPKPSRVERFQNRVEGIQNKFSQSGERVGQTAGVKVAGQKAKIPTIENPSLKSGEQRIVTNDGQTRIEIAPGTKDTPTGQADLKVHEQTAIKDIQNGRTTTRAGELQLEVQKHRDMAAQRLEESQKLPDGSPEKLRLLSEANDLFNQANEYNRLAQTASTEKGSGTGEINSKNGIHNEDFKAQAKPEVTESIQNLELPNGKKYKSIDELLLDYDLTTNPDGSLQLRQRSVELTDDNALQIKYDTAGKPIAIEPISRKPVKPAAYKPDSDYNLTGDKAINTTKEPYRSQSSGERENVSSGKQNEDHNKGRSRKSQEKATAEKTGGENYTDTPEWKAAHSGMIEQSRLIGEEAAHAFMKGQFGDQAELVYGGPGKGSASGDFDQVWKVIKPDGSVEYVVVEAKGGSARLGSREVGDPDYRHQQGTPEYFESVRTNMSNNKKNLNAQTTGDELQLAFENGQVRYVHVETPIVVDPITSKAAIGKTSVREFDLSTKPSTMPTSNSGVNPTVKPATELVPTPSTAPKLNEPSATSLAKTNSTEIQQPQTKNLADTNAEQLTRLQEFVKDTAELEGWLSIPGAKPEYLERLFAICQENDVPLTNFKDEWAMHKPTTQQYQEGKFKWPDNNGALGKIEQTDAPIGEMIDRYGATRGKFVSPSGRADISTKKFEYSPFSHSERALPAPPNESDYHVYVVAKPIPVDKAIAAPWFGESGGATQYMLRDGNIQQYLDSGHLIEVPVSKVKNLDGNANDT